MVYDEAFIIDCKRFILEEDLQLTYNGYHLGKEVLAKVWAKEHKNKMIVNFTDCHNITRQLKFRKKDLVCLNA